MLSSAKVFVIVWLTADVDSSVLLAANVPHETLCIAAFEPAMGRGVASHARCCMRSWSVEAASNLEVAAMNIVANARSGGGGLAGVGPEPALVAPWGLTVRLVR